MTAPQTTVIDMDVLTEFQEEIHLIGEDEEKDQVVGSEFHRPYIKTTHCYNLAIQMDATPSTDSGKSIITFTSKAPYMDYLMYTTRIHQIPSISVRQEYRGLIEICWCHNLGINLAPNGVFMSNTSVISSINKIWMDDHAQFFSQNKNGYVGMQNRCLGNVEEMEEWSHTLPSYVISVKDPWNYSECAALAYPIFYDREAKLVHRYIIQDNISDLLRVRVRDTESSPWTYVTGFSEKYMNGPANGKLPAPELWGYYARIREEDRDRVLYDFFETKDGMLTKEQRQNLVIYTENIICTKDDNIKHYGEVASIQLDTTTPCKGITVKAENLDARDLNNHSNYSTDTYNLRDGYNPVGPFTQTYIDTPKFENMHQVHFERIFPMMHCPSCPEDPGYNIIPISWNLDDHFPSSGIVFQPSFKTVLKIGLMNNQNSITMDKNVDGLKIVECFSKNALVKQQSPRFIVHACLITIRKFCFSYNTAKKCYIIDKVI